MYIHWQEICKLVEQLNIDEKKKKKKLGEIMIEQIKKLKQKIISISMKTKN